MTAYITKATITSDEGTIKCPFTTYGTGLAEDAEADGQVDREEKQLDGATCYEGGLLMMVLPEGYAATHSAEDVRKFVMVQGLIIVLAVSHALVLPLAAPSVFSVTMAVALVVEGYLLHRLRRRHDVVGSAMVLSALINFSVIIGCLHYGFAAEIYVWLGWVPKILSFTCGYKGGALGLALVLVEGSALFALGIAGPPAGGVQIEETARLLMLNSYLVCFGLIVCVHEYCRSTALQRLHAALVQVRKANGELIAAAEAKSMFLATTSHELRTPLHGILALSDSLLERMPPCHAGRKSVNTIAQCGHHLIELLNNILDFEKVGAANFTLECVPFSVACEADKICSTFAATMASKKIKLVKEFTNVGTTRHMGDPLRFRQVLCNLLSNALKFTPSGGTVSVTIACQPTGKVCVEVSDTGVGIAPEAQAKLFRNYVQADSSISRRFGGTGLGLAISKRLVEAMGGEIGCRSTMGQGSTFWFVVPLSLAAADAMENPADALELSDDDGASGMTTSTPADTTARGSGAELKGKRILVVDDNLVNQKVSSAMLRKLGCNVTVAINGQDCLDILQDDHFDAILMDYNMPVLDGIAATQRIRTEEAEHACRRTPVIGLTASESAEANKGALEAGMDDWLQKPFRRAELADKLSRWIAAGGTGSNA